MHPPHSEDKCREDASTPKTQYLSWFNLPVSKKSTCREYFDVIRRSGKMHSFRDEMELANIIAFIVLEENGQKLDVHHFQTPIPLKKLYMVLKILEKDLVQHDHFDMDVITSNSVSTLKNLDPSDGLEDRVSKTTTNLRSFLSGKTRRMCIAIVSYITWQAHGLPLTFTAACKALNIPAPSLRASLKTLAAALGIEWKGAANTMFDSWERAHDSAKMKINRKSFSDDANK